MAKDPRTPVIFRVFNNTNTIIAIFPTLPANIDGQLTSYMHIGQHGECDYDVILRNTKLLSKYSFEYIDIHYNAQQLRKELKSIGYDFYESYCISASMRKEFNENLKKLREETEQA